MPVHVEMIFDDEGHEAETQIDDVSKDDEVGRLDFHSISILGLEGAVVHVEVIYGKIVALQFAALLAADNVILFGNVGTAIEILEKHGIVVAVE